MIPSRPAPDARAKQRVEWLDAAKGVSISLVVLLHATLWVGYVGDAPWWLVAFNEVAGFIRMPLFFLAAGLFSQKWLSASWKDLYRGKLRLLIWVFLIWQPAFFAFKYVGAQVLPEQQDTSLAAHLLRAFVSPLRPQGELWFLWALVLFFIAARLLNRMNARLHLVLAILMALVWVMVVLPFLGDGLVRLLGAGIVSAPYLYMFFLIGLFFRSSILSVAEFFDRHKWVSVLLVALFVGLGAICVYFDVAGVGAVMLGMRLVGLLPGIALSVLLVPTRVFGWLGARTLQIYVAHMPIIATVVILLTLASMSFSGLAFSAVVLVLALLTIGLALLLHRCVRGGIGELLYRAPNRAVLARLGSSSSG